MVNNTDSCVIMRELFCSYDTKIRIGNIVRVVIKQGFEKPPTYKPAFVGQIPSLKRSCESWYRGVR